MSLIPGATGTTTKAVDGIEGATSGSPVSFPSGFQGSAIPASLADSNITLTSASNTVMVMTPTATRVITLPSTSIPANYSITVINRSASFSITVNSSGGNLVTSVGLGQVTVLSTQASPTTAAHWSLSSAGAILQSGNSLGTAMSIGTNDNFALNFKTNNVVNGSIATNGGWVVGPLLSLNYNGPRHSVSGFLYGIVGTAGVSESGDIAVGTNIRFGASNASVGRTDSTTTGAGILFGNQTSNSTWSALFVANKVSDSTATTGLTAGQYNANGQWTIGDAANAAFPGNLIVGRKDGSVVPVGHVGEQIRSFVPNSSAVTIVNNTAKTITSITLTPGVWDISVIGAIAGSLTGTASVIAINTTTDTLPASSTVADSRIQVPFVSSAASDMDLSIPQYRVTISVSTTYYLIALALFSAGSGSAYGRISAVRVA